MPASVGIEFVSEWDEAKLLRATVVFEHLTTSRLAVGKKATCCIHVSGLRNWLAPFNFFRRGAMDDDPGAYTMSRLVSRVSGALGLDNGHATYFGLLSSRDVLPLHRTAC